MNNNKPKKSIKWKVSLILIISITLGIIGTIWFHSIKNDYSIVKHLPVSQVTKSRAWWHSLNNNKLNKLVEDKKIQEFNVDGDGANIIVTDNVHRYMLAFKFQGGLNAIPAVHIYPLSDTLGKTTIIFSTDGFVASGVNDHGLLSQSQIDELTKKGIEIYNQFVEDYNNL